MLGMGDKNGDRTDLIHFRKRSQKREQGVEIRDRMEETFLSQNVV